MATTASIFVKSIIQGSLLTTMHQMKFLSTNCLNMQKSECLKESRDRVPRQTWLAGLVAEYPCNHDTEHTLRDTSRRAARSAPPSPPRFLLLYAEYSLLNGLQLLARRNSRQYQESENCLHSKCKIITLFKKTLARQRHCTVSHNSILAFHGFWILNVTCGIVDDR